MLDLLCLGNKSPHFTKGILVGLLCSKWGGILINFGKFEDTLLLILTSSHLLIFAILELLHICVDHCFKDVNAGAALELNHPFLYFAVFR